MLEDIDSRIQESVLTASRSVCFGPLLISFDDRVLRPRPWTIVQSTWAAGEAALLPPGPILELCAGAGQIGILAAMLTNRPLVAVEQDRVAAAFAARNARAAGVAERVTVRCARFQDALVPGEAFPLILADPPYLDSDEIDHFPADPPLAVDGGADGLGVVRACVQAVSAHLAYGGACLLQLAGAHQVDPVRSFLANAGLNLRVDATLLAEGRAVTLLRRTDDGDG